MRHGTPPRDRHEEESACALPPAGSFPCPGKLTYCSGMPAAGPDGSPAGSSATPDSLLLDGVHVPAELLSVGQQDAQAEVLAQATSAAGAVPTATGSMLPALLRDTPV